MGKQSDRKKVERSERSPSNTKKYVRQTLECLIFVIIMLLLQIPMIYLAGSDTVHVGDPHPLDHAFDSKEYKSILKTLQSSAKKNRYVEIVSGQGSGARQFLDYYASRNKENRTVFTREYSNKSFDTVYSVFRLAKNTLESQLELEQEENKPKTWILIGFQIPVPLADVLQIQNEDPNDKIILLTSEELQFEAFTIIKFPTLSIDKVKSVVEVGLQLSKNQSKVLVDYYETIPQIFDNLNEANFSIQNHLLTHFQDISSLSQKQSKILNTLCRKGKAKVTQNQEERKKQSYRESIKNLQNYGVILVDNQYYWKDQRYILNYALQSNNVCEIVEIDQKMLIKHIEQKTERERLQRQDEDEKEIFGFEEQEQDEQQAKEQVPLSDHQLQKQVPQVSIGSQRVYQETQVSQPKKPETISQQEEQKLSQQLKKYVQIEEEKVVQNEQKGKKSSSSNSKPQNKNVKGNQSKQGKKKSEQAKKSKGKSKKK